MPPAAAAVYTCAQWQPLSLRLIWNTIAYISRFLLPSHVAMADSAGSNPGNQAGKQPARPVKGDDPSSTPVDTDAAKTRANFKARRRTKTGCLSMSSTIPNHCTLIIRSLPQAPHQVWRRTARLRELHQIQTQLRRLCSQTDLQRSSGSLYSWLGPTVDRHRSHTFRSAADKCPACHYIQLGTRRLVSVSNHCTATCSPTSGISP